MKLTNPSKTSTSQSTIIIILLSILIFFIPPSTVAAARVTNPKRVPKNAVLLSKVNTLTLRAGKPTSHRRVAAVPQIQCAGPSSRICKLYEIDSIRCKNQGSDYDDENIQWTCSASLPEEFKLGSTEVTCEGYESSDDPYVLKGSCGVEYRLLLTEKGEEKYGGKVDNNWDSTKSLFEKGGRILFWLIFFGVIIFIALSAMGCFPPRGARPDRGPRPGGGGGGGGDDGWDDDPRGPPPPYDSTTPRKYNKTSSSTNRQPNTQNAGWRPGFWSGALGGATAGYLAGQRGRGGGEQRQQQQAAAATRGGLWGSNPNAGPSNNSRPSAPSSPSYSSSRYESSGFGSTSRR